MRIAICDDKAEERALIVKMTKKIFDDEKNTVAEFDNGTDLINDHNLERFNIILLDVDMPERTGIEVGKYLRANDANTILIFITSFPQYAIEAYDCDAFHYLLKPINSEKFEQVLQKAVQKITIMTSKVVLNSQRGVCVIQVNDIYYIDSLRHNLTYHTTDGDFIVRDSLSNALGQLSAHGFCQTHQGNIVNLGKIQKISQGEAVLSNGTKVPISVRKQKEVEQTFINFLERTL
ncbi:MAG: response regulator transcription factor [Clostridia bacterium]|nr:response regulator transcription factor [Clostridia bacterium]MBO5299607.1 response regulator transcription factor [Clostridia bacterium]MBQ2720513.1 response regulator transcription factor [Clostridia bacterium]MBQ4628234.1 response regulator transcription factor [Clostridia bacterium]